MNPKYNILHSLELFCPTNWLLLNVWTCLNYSIGLSIFLLPGINLLTLGFNCSQHCVFRTGDAELANAEIADGRPCYGGKGCWMLCSLLFCWVLGFFHNSFCTFPLVLFLCDICGGKTEALRNNGKQTVLKCLGYCYLKSGVSLSTYKVIE